MGVTIYLNDNISGIEIAKFAKGEQTAEYFEEGGQQIVLQKGEEWLTAEGTIIVTENGTYTVYVRDVAGNISTQTFEVTTINDNPDPEPEEDTTPPTISTSKEVADDKQTVQVTINVADTQSQIEVVKIANGEQTVEYFANSGTELDKVLGDKTSTSLVQLDENGTYTIYAEDEKGNKTVNVINITEIETQKPEPGDTTPPVISGVEDGRTYTSRISPRAQDENLKEVTLTRNNVVVEDYRNGDTISNSGNYVLTAIDEAGNTTTVRFTIDIEQTGGNNTDNNTGNNTNTNNTNTNNTNTNNTNTNNTNTNTNSTNTDNTTNTNNTNTNTGNNNSSSSGTTNNGTNNNQNNYASTSNSSRLPYAGTRNVIIIAIAIFGIIAVFSFVKYRKYNKIK